MPIRFRAADALEDLRDHGAHAEQQGALGRPVHPSIGQPYTTQDLRPPATRRAGCFGLWDSRGFDAYTGVYATLQNIEKPTLSRSRPLLRIAAVLAGLVPWMGSASAGPGVIVPSRAEAFTAPSWDASVAAELGRGAQICVLDKTNYPGVLLHRLGWLAVRLRGGVGYVPVEAVDLTAPAPEVQECGAPASGPEGHARAPALAPWSASARSAVGSSRSVAHDSEPAAVERPALIAGGFLPLRPARFLLGLGTGMAWLNKESAAQHRIDDSGVTFNGTLGLLLWDVVMVSGSISAAFPSDHAPFSEVVVPEMGGGDPQSADSGLTLASYSIAAGLRTPFWALGPSAHGWVATAVFAQYGTAGIHGSRAISNCVDCRKDELEMPGGTFWHVGVDLLVPSSKPAASYGVTVSYQRYAAGSGLSDEVRIGFSCWLQ
jgi:hypothetical protein